MVKGRVPETETRLPRVRIARQRVWHRDLLCLVPTSVIMVYASRRSWVFKQDHTESAAYQGLELVATRELTLA